MFRRSFARPVGLVLSFVLAACGTNPASSRADETATPISFASTTSAPSPESSDPASTSTATPAQVSTTRKPSSTKPPTTAPVTSPATIPFSRPSTVYGFVTAGPTCPVERVDHPCPPRPLSTTVQARSIGGGTSGSATTDENGRYEMSLPPGRYVLEAQIGSMFPSCQPIEVVVTANAATRGDIDCDTGIRN